MANINAAGTVQSELNRSSPAANDAKLGDVLADLIFRVTVLQNRLNTYCASSAGLVIKAASSTLAKAGTAFIAYVNGTLVRKAANTDMPALAGTLATAKSAAWVFYVDATGTLSVSTKTADAADHASAVALIPATPSGLAQIGILVLDNATGSNFVGGTTALDAASLTATYYNTHGVNFAGTLSTPTDLESRY